MNMGLIRNNLKNFGLFNTSYDLALRAINRITLVKVLMCLRILTVDPDYLNIDNKYNHGFLSESELRKFSGNGEYELSERFLDQALAKGDQCYAILDGDLLASYGWYSNKPTNIYPEELVLQFSDRFIYMYKGFTHLKYRGERLHAIGMTWALKIYLEKGYEGFVSYVESSNFGSLKSVYRMGYENCGKLYIAKIFNKYLIHSDNDCKEYGFRIDVSELEPKLLTNAHP